MRPVRRGAAPVPRDTAADGDHALDQVFGSLSDPIRRGMLTRLAQGPCSVTELGEPFVVSAPAISKHLAVLERSGLVERWKAGRVHFAGCLRGRYSRPEIGSTASDVLGTSARCARRLSEQGRRKCREPSHPPLTPFGSDAGSAPRPKKSSAPGRTAGGAEGVVLPARVGQPSTVEIDLRVGGGYRIGMKQAGFGAEVSVCGRFIEVRPAQWLRYTWRWEGAFDGMEHPGHGRVHRARRRDRIDPAARDSDDIEARQQHWIGWISACNRLECSLPAA